MTRKFLFAALLIAISYAGQAQEVVIKPSVGVNFTNFSKEPGENKFSAQTGYQIGGSVSFGQKFYIEPGVFYVRKSTNYTTTSPDSSGITGSNKGNFHLSGIRIPVAIGYSIIGGGSPKDPFGLRIFGGGSAFLLTTTNQGQLSDFNKAQWGVFAGAGIDIGSFFLDAKYEWSLTNLQKDVSQVDIGKTRSIYINAGIRIPIGN